jgi:hypothetical protein
MLNPVFQYIQNQLGLKGYSIENIGSVWTELKLSNKNSSHLWYCYTTMLPYCVCQNRRIIITWKEPSASLLTIAALCHQLSNRSSFRPTIIFKFVAAKIFLCRWKKMIIVRHQIRAEFGIFCGFWLRTYETCKLVFLLTVVWTASVEGLSVETIDKFSHGNFHRLITICLSGSVPSTVKYYVCSKVKKK